MAAKDSVSQMPLSLRRTLAMGPAFLPAESGPCWSDRRIHFLPEKVATAEDRPGRAFLPLHPCPQASTGLCTRQPPQPGEGFIAQTQPGKLNTTQATEPLCSPPGFPGRGAFGLCLTHGPRRLSHRPPLCHPVPAPRR